MEEEKILNVTQLQVVDKIQNDDVILLIRDTGNGKQCFQIKGSDFRGESAYEAALKQGFVGTYQDFTQHIKEITKYKSKPKTQYIIGKAIPIGELSGGARLNAYLVRYGCFNFRLYNVPQLSQFISAGHVSKVIELLAGVTWHVFIDDMEVYTGKGSFIFRGLLYIYIPKFDNLEEFFKLDESRSSVDLSSDMYIYLTNLESLYLQNFTSKTLFLFNRTRIWKPTFESLYFSGTFLYNFHSGAIQLQKLRTNQRSSKKVGQSRRKLHVRKYRGQCDNENIPTYGTYRYRLVKNGKKTQWRTISIMNNEGSNYSIK